MDSSRLVIAATTLPAGPQLKAAAKHTARKRLVRRFIVQSDVAVLNATLAQFRLRGLEVNSIDPAPGASEPRKTAGPAALTLPGDDWRAWGWELAVICMTCYTGAGTLT
jgi:hypothetical protein